MKQIIKESALFSLIYWVIGSLLINILKIFVKTDKHLILFVSFSGRQFSDSPKMIYEKIKMDPRFINYKLIWGFSDPEEFSLPDNEKVKIDTLQYFILALKARFWITNSSIERLLSFKGRDTFYINTWHGVPLKRLGLDQGDLTRVVKRWYKHSKIDLMTAESVYDKRLFSHIFNIGENKIQIIGLPRNDKLRMYNLEDISSIKRKFNIPPNKKVILYAPTFREYLLDRVKNNYIKPMINFKLWAKELKGEYVVLLRAHYFVNKIVDVNFEDDFFIDVTHYPDINDLMVISDLLVSDYSSVFFDYSLLCKPMICYAYDYKQYSQKRGFYINIKEKLPNFVINETNLLNEIKNIDLQLEKEKTRRFKVNYTCNEGQSTSKLVDIMYSKILSN
jgi:CDP-glycerol glycerophosphotransferase